MFRNVGFLNAHHLKALASPLGAVTISKFAGTLPKQIVDTYKAVLMSIHELNSKEFRKSDIPDMQKRAKLAACR